MPVNEVIVKKCFSLPTYYLLVLTEEQKYHHPQKTNQRGEGPSP